MRREGRTTTLSLTPAGSSSHARRATTDAQAALLLAREVLHYRPIDDLYEEWLARITELVSAGGALPRRPSRCLALQEWATRLRERIHHLSPKKTPWLQGARPLDVTHHIQRLHDKKEAAKKSLDLKKALPCFLHQHDKSASLHRHAKTPYCPWRQCAGTTKSKPSVSKGLR